MTGQIDIRARTVNSRDITNRCFGVELEAGGREGDFKEFVYSGSLQPLFPALVSEGSELSLPKDSSCPATCGKNTGQTALFEVTAPQVVSTQHYQCANLVYAEMVHP
jgi:hypothetical protein